MREAKIVVPRFLNDGHGSTMAARARLAETLARAFGGLTETEGSGIWYAPDGAAVREPVTVYTVAAPDNVHSDRILRVAAATFGRETSQEAVYISYPNGEVDIFNPNEEFKVSKDTPVALQG